MRLSLGLLAVALLFYSPMGAQTSASLSGTVLDPSGAAIPGATVTIQNQATNDPRTTTANQDGYFTFASLGVGTYTVTVNAVGLPTGGGQM